MAYRVTNEFLKVIVDILYDTVSDADHDMYSGVDICIASTGALDITGCDVPTSSNILPGIVLLNITNNKIDLAHVIRSRTLHDIELKEKSNNIIVKEISDAFLHILQHDNIARYTDGIRCDVSATGVIAVKLASELFVINCTTAVDSGDVLRLCIRTILDDVLYTVRSRLESIRAIAAIDKLLVSTQNRVARNKLVDIVLLIISSLLGVVVILAICNRCSRRLRV